MPKYFIVYRGPGGGHGRVQTETIKPITGIADIEQIEKELSERNGVKMMVTYWKRFEEEEEA